MDARKKPTRIDSSDCHIAGRAGSALGGETRRLRPNHLSAHADRNFGAAGSAECSRNDVVPRRHQRGKTEGEIEQEERNGGGGDEGDKEIIAE